MSFSYYLQSVKGKIVVRDGANEEIEQQWTYYLSDEKDIELYSRHQNVIKELNQLAVDLKAHMNATILTSAFLVHFDIIGFAFASSNINCTK